MEKILNLNPQKTKFKILKPQQPEEPLLPKKGEATQEHNEPTEETSEPQKFIIYSETSYLNPQEFTSYSLLPDDLENMDDTYEPNFPAKVEVEDSNFMRISQSEGIVNLLGPDVSDSTLDSSVPETAERNERDGRAETDERVAERGSSPTPVESGWVTDLMRFMWDIVLCVIGFFSIKKAYLSLESVWTKTKFLVLLYLALCFPPIAVYMKSGLSRTLVFNLFLCCFLWIPGKHLRI